MRIKTRAQRRPAISKIPPKPSTMAVRILSHLGSCSEDHAASSVHGTTINEAEGKTYSDSDGREQDCASPSSRGRTKTAVLAKKCGNSEPDASLENQRKQKLKCIKCDKGGQVLACSESGCLLAVHDKCMGCSASFDDEGHFYCPYCWYKRASAESIQAKERYKRAAAESNQAKEKAMLAKKALSNFIIDGNTQKQNATILAERKEPNSSSITRDGNYDDHEVVPNQSLQEGEDPHPRVGAEASTSWGNDVVFGRKAELANSNQPTTVVEQEMISVPNSRDNCRQEKTTPADDSLRASISIVKGEINNANNPQTHEVVVDDDVGETMQVDDHHHHGDRDREVVEEELPSEENFDSVRKPSSQVKTTATATAEENTGDRNTKVITSNKSRQPGEHSKLFTKRSTFHSARRKKLLWTTEEEEMLREGVHKFSTKVNKNLPWRKILELGHHIFHQSRTPSDLKDKWRNILGKESSAIS